MLKEKKTTDVEPFEESIEKVEEVKENREVKKPAVKKSVDVEKYIERKLKVINEWPDGAKKRAAVERLFRNKEAKK